MHSRRCRRFDDPAVRWGEPTGTVPRRKSPEARHRVRRGACISAANELESPRSDRRLDDRSAPVCSRRSRRATARTTIETGPRRPTGEYSMIRFPAATSTILQMGLVLVLASLAVSPTTPVVAREGEKNSAAFFERDVYVSG